MWKSENSGIKKAALFGQPLSGFIIPIFNYQG